MKEGENRILKTIISPEVGTTMAIEVEHFEQLFNEGQFTAEDLREFNKKHDFK